MSGAYTSDDLIEALKQTASLVSLPIRPPMWVRAPWWAYPLNETRCRPIPANSDWTDYIVIELGKTPGLAPVGYSLRLTGYVATTQGDPLTSGVEYRFIRNGLPLPAQEFDITNTIEKHVMRYTDPEPWPAFSRKIFLHVANQGRLVLQVKNPSGADQIAIAALYGYYYPNLGDTPRGGLENVGTGWPHEDAEQGGGRNAYLK